MQVEEDHVKLALFQQAGRFRASREGQRFHSSGLQHFPDQVANRWFVIDDESTPVHVSLSIALLACSSN